MIKVAVQTARSTNFGKKDQIAIFFDYIYCRRKFHVEVKEYLKYRYYNYKNRYRKNFLLDYHQVKRFKRINEPGFTNSKYKFYKYIPDLYSRELILAPDCGEEAFLEFLKKHKRILVKPDLGSLGRDIKILTYIDDQHAIEFFSGLTEPTICEEVIRQHSELDRINRDSVNTIRVVSLRNKGEVEIISATLKSAGQPGVIIDNLKKKGVGAQIDVANGIVNTHGFDYEDNIYVNHPISGTQLLGFNIPNWDKLVELVKEAHMRLPQCAMFGWDIAITQDGADIIEANNRPGTQIMQWGHLEPKGEEIINYLANKKNLVYKGRARRKKK